MGSFLGVTLVDFGVAMTLETIAGAAGHLTGFSVFVAVLTIVIYTPCRILVGDHPKLHRATIIAAILVGLLVEGIYGTR